MIDYSAAGFILLQGAHLYAPEDWGICDVLVANDKIIVVVSNISSDVVSDCAAADLSGQIFCPGLTNQHVHLIDGGGETGSTIRTPEMALSCLMKAGIMSAVGLLGTDSIFCRPESLLARTRALNEEGISVWMLTGVYHVSSRTTMGSVKKDAVIIGHVIDVKRAIFNHHSVVPDVYHLANMAAESRVGGLLGDKPGITVFHMGDSKEALQPVYDLPENCDVPISKLLPTHVNRNVPLFERALGLVRKGNTIDVASSINEPVAPTEGTARAVQTGISLTRVILSPDGDDSQPFFDDEGSLTRIGVTGLEILLETV